MIEGKEIFLVYGLRSPLWNLRFSDITVDGMKYNSVEQYINAMKAKHFRDEKALDLIMKMQQPIDTRSVRIQDFYIDEWNGAVRDIVWKGLMAKVYLLCTFVLFVCNFLNTFSSHRTRAVANICFS